MTINKTEVARLLLASGRYDQLSLRKVAKLTGIPYTTVHSAYRRLRVAARKSLTVIDQNNTFRG